MAMSVARAGQELAPIFVVAPTARHGITLIQRLLNSSREIVVFGENVMLMRDLPTLTRSAIDIHGHRDEMDRARAHFQTVTTEGWTSNLWPDTEQWLLLQFEHFYRSCLFYQQQAELMGCSRWGVKNPLTDATMIDLLRPLLPKAKFVFMTRRPTDALRSAKARGFVKTVNEAEQFLDRCFKYAHHVLARPGDDLLHIEYEMLLEGPEKMISALSRFTGIGNIDHTTLDRKFNTFASQSSSGYVEAKPLSEAELDLACRIEASWAAKVDTPSE